MKPTPLPHSLEAEQGALACCLTEPQRIAELARLPHDLFWDLRHANLWRVLREMHSRGEVIEPTTVVQRLKDKRLLRECGGLQYLAELPDKTPSPANLPYYLSILREKHALRKLWQVCAQAQERIMANESDVRSVCLGVQADLDTVSRLGIAGAEARRVLVVHNAAEIGDMAVDPRLLLVGDNEICAGYDGICLIAGPGGSGKSLVSLTLALAGAIGQGTWMGRKVHRRFRTLIIQAENGIVRLKAEFEALKKNHPELNLDEWIFISEPPEGGLPFHRPEFRAAVREIIAKLKPNLIIIDPWAQVAADDSAKDVVDRLGLIRSCFPPGEACPGLVIVAHTKKPRADEVRRGRSLAHQVSGSIALVNTARCVYMLLPWSDDPEDPRCYWCCAKLNNGEMYPPSVWKRRFGTFWEHDPSTDPREWGKEDEGDARHAITEGQLRDAFGNDEELPTRDLVRRLTRMAGCGESTAYKAVGEDGYLRALLVRNGNGRLKLRFLDPIR